MGWAAGTRREAYAGDVGSIGGDDAAACEGAIAGVLIEGGGSASEGSRAEAVAAFDEGFAGHAADGSAETRVCHMAVHFCGAARVVGPGGVVVSGRNCWCVWVGMWQAIYGGMQREREGAKMGDRCLGCKRANDGTVAGVVFLKRFWYCLACYMARVV